MNSCNRCLIVAVFFVSTLAACQSRRDVVIFHAASVSAVFSELAQAYSKAHPDERLRLEASGSQTAARKVAELNRRADVIVSADTAVLERILLPEHASWTIDIATNEMVLVHGAHSRFTEETTSENWFEVLQRPEVRIGSVDPSLAPIGYRTLLVWQLAELHHAPDPHVVSLTSRLREKVLHEHLMADENQLLALLSSRTIDYAMMYRSTAEEHHLKMTLLPSEINLGDAKMASTYGRAAVTVEMKHGVSTKLIGSPVVYGLTVPGVAQNPEGAERLIELILSAPGRRAFERRGFRPLIPARSRYYDLLPPGFRESVERESP
ncbi:MAG: hypothetical protein A2289_00490 [Deltaproteobacteria bacterium RIFOXYA12_FULL_58_15]|nr:MAG: hypothetical protein A2289_00490 [Deltaproteobacteria bacterium RIFOXYA12_FULL_58_15]OGR07221.1 MAG: hypothetical protein A2341_11140 [Deltaproteobacteria bacterium RIFOXYB12_FULL_58_9]